MVESGADLTIEHPDLFPKSLHTGYHRVIPMADGSIKTCPIAKFKVHLGDWPIHNEVVAFNACREDAPLGTELKLHQFFAQLSKDQERRNPSSTIRITRRQEAEEVEQENLGDAATAPSGSEPFNLDDIYEFDDSLFEDDDHLDQLQATSEGDELALPLAPSHEGQGDYTLLIQQHVEDVSLTNV